jgi:hypothetical protein
MTKSQRLQKQAAYAREAKQAKHADRVERDRLVDRAIHQVKLKDPNAEKYEASMTTAGITVVAWRNGKGRLYRFRELKW